MASGFSTQTQVLHYPAKDRHKDSFLLIWPAVAYQVVAPQERKRKLNHLQRAVLGLCRIHLKQAPEIAELLNVDPDLVRYIQDQLKQEKLLLRNGALSATGDKALEDEEMEVEDLAVGYVFQDPWTGELWPRFTSERHVVGATYQEDGSIMLELGTPGSPRSRKGFLVTGPREVTHAKPDVDQILEATVRHRRALSNQRDDEHPYQKPPSKLQRVSFVDDAPLPYYLSTEVFIGADSALAWEVRDPLGSMPVGWLRQAIERKAKDFPELAKRIQGLGRRARPNPEDSGSWHDMLVAAAHEEVLKRLPQGDPSHPSVRQLHQVERQRLEAEDLGKRVSADRISSLMIETAKVLELFFAQLAAKAPYFGHALPRNAPNHEDIYQDWACTVGFEALPESLASVRPNKVYGAQKFHKSTLQPLILLSLWAALNEADHPLHAIAREAPDILTLCARLSADRDAAAHATQQAFTAQRVLPHLETIYRLLALYFGPADAAPILELEVSLG